ncbi:MAG: hypothetical protein KatS3mg087_0322 [Patescibacteria group bacterium]|nr:MAG: hypothetical protein KatS3mg087_0322 [Patescibacteria group bacterium]
MPRRKLKDTQKRKLISLGNGSLVVSIPIDLARELNWRKGTALVVRKYGQGIIIKKHTTTPKS